MDFVSDDQILLGREAESRHELLRMLCAQAEAMGIVKDAVALFVPEANREEHIRLLSKTAVLLMDPAFRKMLRTTDDVHAIASAIADAIAQE